MKKYFLIIVLILSFFLVKLVLAVPSNPIPFTLEQPSEEKFEARQAGDERNAWIETLEGYTITQNILGEWVYAEEGIRSESEINNLINSGKFKGLSGTHILKPTNLIVGRDLPRGLEKHIRPRTSNPGQKTSQRNEDEKESLVKEELEEEIEKSSPLYQSAFSQGFPSYSPGTIGTEYIVVIPIQFTDVIFSSGYNQIYYENLIFNPSNPGSMYSYYDEVSYGQLSITGIVAPVVTSSKTMDWYGADGPPNTCGNIDGRNGCIYELAREAVQLSDPYVNFSLYDKDGNSYVDHLMIVHAGGAQESSSDSNTIWSHRWVIQPAEVVDGKNAYGYTMLAESSPVGTFAHEFGHDLGLPDLYNTATGGTVVGYWDLMDIGSWGGSPSGSSPVHISSWGKIQLNWINATIMNGSQLTTNVNQLATNNDSYKLEDVYLARENEYFLVENRQKTGFDNGLPSGYNAGLVVWHIDDRQTNNNGATKKIIPEMAGGSLSTAAFFSPSYTYFNSTSTPNTDTNSGNKTTVYAVNIGSPGSSIPVTLFGGVARLQPYLITTSKDVAQNQTFSFSAGVRCLVGNCGNVSAWLDPETEIYYDNGIAAVYYNYPSNSIFAVRFTPPYYNSLIGKAKVMLYDLNAVGSAPSTIYVYDDDNGNPGQVLFSLNTTITTFYSSWAEVSLPNVSILDSDFWVGIKVPGSPNGPFMLADSGTTTYRSYYWSGSSWNSLSRDLMIRAIVSEGSILDKGGIISTTLGDKPFYTTSSQPQSCGGMTAGDTCNLTWSVNATGSLGLYKFFAIFNSSLPLVQVESERVNVTIMEQVPTLTGDVNGDCVVDILDLSSVGFCFGLSPTGGCESSDINSDGFIDILDLSTVGFNFGNVC